MKYYVERAFIKDLKSLPKDVKEAVRDYFNFVEKASAFNELSDNLTKLTGHKIYYRYRIGDYRIGIAFRDNMVTFIRIIHRREIYRFFPPE